MLHYILVALFLYYLIVQYQKRQSVLVQNSSSSHLPETDNSALIRAPMEIRGKRRAVCFGINYLGTENQLAGCIQDAYHMQEMLLKSYNYDQVIVVTDETNVRATRSNMMHAIHWLVRDSKAGDSLVVHYSGHGSQLADRSGDEADRLDECILPLDFAREGTITDDELFQKLVVPLSGTGARLVGVFDCCHSGTQMDLRHRYEWRQGRVLTSTRQKRARSSIDVDVTYLGAARDAELSADVQEEDGAAYGLFTHVLLDTLRNANFQLSYEQMLQSLETQIRSRNGNQHSQLSSWNPLSLSHSFYF
jgi:metacaspase-1